MKFAALVRPPNDVFYTELQARKATVSRFLPTLLRVIRFDANPAAQPLAQALQWLHEKPDHDPPTAIVGKAWQRHVVQEDGRINATAYSFCALDKLRSAIRRRDVFISPSWRYADPRAGLKRIRHYGLLANPNGAQLAQAKAALHMPAPNPQAQECAQGFMARVARVDIQQCPVCQRGRMGVVQALAGAKRLPDPLDKSGSRKANGWAPPAQGP